MSVLIRIGSAAPVNLLMRFGCVAVYLAGLAGAAGRLPPGMSETAQWFALFVLVAHTLELFIFLRHLRLYPGPPAAAVTLAILFGSLHWFPLFQRHKKPRTPS